MQQEKLDQQRRVTFEFPKTAANLIADTRQRQIRLQFDVDAGNPTTTEVVDWAKRDIPISYSITVSSSKPAPHKMGAARQIANAVRGEFSGMKQFVARKLARRSREVEVSPLTLDNSRGALVAQMTLTVSKAANYDEVYAKVHRSLSAQQGRLNTSDPALNSPRYEGLIPYDDAVIDGMPKEAERVGRVRRLPPTDQAANQALRKLFGIRDEHGRQDYDGRSL